MSASGPIDTRALADDAVRGLLVPLRHALSEADEASRYRAVAALLLDLADGNHVGMVAERDAVEQREALHKRLQSCEESRASLQDSYSAVQAELRHRETRLDAERTRAEELQKVVVEQRSRLEGTRRELEDAQTRLTSRERELHALRSDHERLELTVQRLEARPSQPGAGESAERELRQLRERVGEVEEELRQHHEEKNAQLETLRAELESARAAASQGADALLAELWTRLAQCKPSLVEGHVPPTPQAVERQFDAFVTLVQFSHELEEGMRVFLGRYTQTHASVKVPWEVYAKSDSVLKKVQATVAVERGRFVGPLRMRLRLLHAWITAAMLGSDAAVESIASELHAHLLGGDSGGAWDPNKKIRDYLRNDGPELFQQRLRGVRGEKLAETYGRMV